MLSIGIATVGGVVGGEEKDMLKQRLVQEIRDWSWSRGEAIECQSFNSLVKGKFGFLLVR